MITIKRPHIENRNSSYYVITEISSTTENISKEIWYRTTEEYADYQWKRPVEASVSIRLRDLNKDHKAIVEFVPNFTDNEPKSALVEFKDGNADFIFCGFDLTLEDNATKALKKSLKEDRSQ